jgi:glycosyltransferase involved in cell wall biosynthesis
MPRVSVIVPCFNEEKTIEILLQALSKQTFSLSELEVIISDGLSTDRTREKIGDFASRNPDLFLRVVDNIQRNIPSGLNRAIEAARGEIIIRLDAHSVPADDFIERSVRALDEARGENVGGVWNIQPSANTWVARAIAAAASHPLGAGDALYRYTTEAAYVDTVPFGAYRREMVVSLGMYDETLLTNEDYELNVRIRRGGGRIWLDPLIRSVYFARSRFRDLARQYFRYGFWKQRMLRRYPGTLRLRQAVPPLFVLGMILFGMMSFFLPLARILLLIALVVYFLALWVGSIGTVLRKRDPALAVGMPWAIAVMHFSWGLGFWLSMMRK